MTDLADDILMHYGKKGMKWGVRTAQARESVKKAGTKAKESVTNRPSNKEIESARLGVRSTYISKQAERKKAVKTAKADAKSEFKSSVKDIKRSQQYKTANKFTKGELVTTAAATAFAAWTIADIVRG